MAPRSGGSGCWKKKRAARLSSRRLKPASTSLIPRTCIPLGASEQVLGRALKDFGPSRDKLVIATKVFFPLGDDPNQKGLSRKHIMHAIDDSLRRLGTDYVDLYQIHRFDYETPIEETLTALHDVVKSGKARYIGASSMFAWQFAQMLHTSDRLGLTRFVTMQNHYNLDLSRRRARDDSFVPSRRRRSYSVESAGARRLDGKSQSGNRCAPRKMITPKSSTRRKLMTVWWRVWLKWRRVAACRRRSRASMAVAQT